jgi:hypothetical protein
MGLACTYGVRLRSFGWTPYAVTELGVWHIVRITRKSGFVGANFFWKDRRWNGSLMLMSCREKSQSRTQYVDVPLRTFLRRHLPTSPPSGNSNQRLITRIDKAGLLPGKSGRIAWIWGISASSSSAVILLSANLTWNLAASEMSLQ